MQLRQEVAGAEACDGAQQPENLQESLARAQEQRMAAEVSMRHAPCQDQDLK